MFAEDKKIDSVFGTLTYFSSGPVTVLLQASYDNGATYDNIASVTLKGNYQDLEMGRLDAVIAQDVEALIAIKENNLKLKLVETPIQFGEVAFPVQKNEKGKALADDINKVIKEMQEDGTLTKLSEKWLGYDITKEVK